MPAGEGGEFVAHDRPADAALAEKRVDQKRPRRRLGQLAEHAQHPVLALHRQDFIFEDVGVEPGGVHQAAGQRKGLAREGGGSIEVRPLQLGKMEPGVLDQVLQLGEGQHAGDLAGHCRLQNLRLLRRARPDENHLGLFAVAAVDGPRGGDHGRDHRHQRRKQRGHVLLDIADDSGTGGGDQGAALVAHALEELAVLPADQLGPEGHVPDLDRAQPMQSSDDGARVAVGKGGGEGRGEGGEDRVRTGQQPPGLGGRVLDLLRLLGADLDAVAAGNAALGDDRGLTLVDLDRLGRALAHAGVTAPALLGYGGDNAHWILSTIILGGSERRNREKLKSKK